MSLGRSRRKVLVIDSGTPCNRQTPASHNFLSRDGIAPGELAAIAKKEVAAYPTVHTLSALAVGATGDDGNFSIVTDDGEEYFAAKLLFATGLQDLMPADIPGVAECWGISVLHCPYCHGYEVADKRIGVMSNADVGYEITRLVSNWTDKLTLYTNAEPVLSDEQKEKLAHNNIIVEPKIITRLVHTNGKLEAIVFFDETTQPVDALFARLPFQQQCALPEAMGCALDKHCFIAVDSCQMTSVAGVYAAGDCTSLFRAVSAAVAGGNRAGAFINKALIEERF